MLKFLQLLFRDCELAVKANTVHGFSAAAKGPFAVIAVIIMFAIMAVIALAYVA